MSKFARSCLDIVHPKLDVPSLQNIAKDMKVIVSVGGPKVVKLSGSGGFAPWPTDLGLYPLTPLGAPPPDPLIRRCSALYDALTTKQARASLTSLFVVVDFTQPAVTETIASTYCNYPRKDNQADRAWVDCIHWIAMSPLTLCELLFTLITYWS